MDLSIMEQPSEDDSDDGMYDDLWDDGYCEVCGLRLELCECEEDSDLDDDDYLDDLYPDDEDDEPVVRRLRRYE